MAADTTSTAARSRQNHIRTVGGIFAVALGIARDECSRDKSPKWRTTVLVGVAMLRSRGMWTTNLVAFVFGGGMCASIAIAALPETTL